MLLLIPANCQSVVHQNIQTVSSYNGQLGTGSTGKATTPQEPFEPLRAYPKNGSNPHEKVVFRIGSYITTTG